MHSYISHINIYMYNSYPINNIQIIFNNTICQCTYTLITSFKKSCRYTTQQLSPMYNSTIITNVQSNNYHQCTIQQLSPMYNPTIITNNSNACNVLDSSRCMRYQITSRSSPSMQQTHRM